MERVRDEYADVMRDGFPTAEIKECAYCGEEIEDDEYLCRDCLRKYMADWEIAVDYLQSQKIQKIGFTSWTDFVLRTVFGIEKTTGERDSLLEENLERHIEDTPETRADIAEYISEDSYDFEQWLLKARIV